VTALVRSATSLAPAQKDGLTMVTGTPLNRADIDAAFAATPEDAATAVVVTLKARAASKDGPKATTLMADSVTNALASMRQHAVRKLVVMQAQGTGASWPSLNFAIRVLFTHNEGFRADFDDHNQVEHIVRREAVAGQVDFVLLRPVMLVAGDSRPVQHLPEEGAGAGWLPRITRKSVAAALLDAAESSKLDGTAPVICN
jgi:hypothetical protein